MKLTMTSSGLMFLPEDIREEHDWWKLREYKDNRTGYGIPVLGRQGQRLEIILPSIDSFRKKRS